MDNDQVSLWNDPNAFTQDKRVKAMGSEGSFMTIIYDGCQLIYNYSEKQWPSRWVMEGDTGQSDRNVGSGNQDPCELLCRIMTWWGS